MKDLIDSVCIFTTNTKLINLNQCHPKQNKTKTLIFIITKHKTDYDLTATECRTIPGFQNPGPRQIVDAYKICFTFNIDLTAGRVYGVATGPAITWFAVGLATINMDNAYSIIIFNDTVIEERRLIRAGAGKLLQPQSIEIIENTQENGMRIAKFWFH